MRCPVIPVLFVFFLIIVCAAQSRAGVCWPEAGLPVATGTDEQVPSLVIADGLGGSIIIWQGAGSSYAILYADRLNQRGQSLWSAGGVRLTTFDSNQRYPTAVSDGAGGCLVFWDDDRAGAYTQIYGQRLNDQGARSWADAAVQVNATTAYQADPAAVMDGSGGAVVVWRDWRYDSGNGDVDLLAARLNSAGSFSWSGGFRPISIATTPEGAPALAGDGAGGVFVGWRTDEPETNDDDIFAQYLGPAGDRLWGDFGVTVCNATGFQGYVAVAADGQGGMWQAWGDQRGTPTAVYLQRLNSSGAPLLTANGERISHSARSSITPAMAPDGAGGVFVAYPATSTGGTGLFYRHARPGVAMLADNDRPIYAEPGFSWYAAVPMAADGRGGCFVAWPDARTGTTRMYAQYLYAGYSGTFLEGGMPLANVDSYQAYASLAVTDTGRAVCAWGDDRNNGAGDHMDVFAQALAQPAASQGALPLLLNW